MESEKIKIVHILEGFTGGLATYMQNVLPLLADNGFDVTLICSLRRSSPDAPEKIAMLKDRGIHILLLPMQRGINPFIDLYCFISIWRFLRKNRFSIVHTHCSKAGALGRLAASMAGIKTRFHSSHCFAFLRCRNLFAKKFYLLIERFLSRFTTTFIAVSKADAEAAIKYRIFRKEKCVIINNGLCLHERLLENQENSRKSINKANLGIDSKSFVVVTACRLVEYKGIFSLLNAARFSKANCVFVLAGEGELKEKIKSFIIGNDLAQKVRLAGYVVNMEALYGIADVVALCSAMEAQPYLLLEAMRANRPIVATDVPGNRELLSSGRGLLVQDDPGKIASSIDELLFNQDMKQSLIQNAYDHFRKYHDLNTQIWRLKDIYKKVLSY
jgi:glycosyltransferase involved in cell wall biosynthesis